MIKIAMLFFLLITHVSHAYYEMDAKVVERFIKHVEEHNIEQLARHVEYPLHQPFKIPSIKDGAEFVSRFDEVFDEELMEAITHSSIEDDWSAVGWRGIMFGSGQVWLTYEGNLRGVNHTTAKTLELKAESFAQERKRLHPSLHQFIYPSLEWKTKNYTIRVDEVQDREYRYAAWFKGQSTLDQPYLILEGGTYHAEGSGGNHHYKFKQGSYTYHVDVNVMGKFSYEEMPGYLEIFEEDKSILNERARARYHAGKYVPSSEVAVRVYEGFEK